jgi:hypothetical protein
VCQLEGAGTGADRHDEHAQPRGGEEEHQPFGHVGQPDRQHVTALEAESHEAGRHPGGVGVQFLVGDATLAGNHRDPIAMLGKECVKRRAGHPAVRHCRTRAVP